MPHFSYMGRDTGPTGAWNRAIKMTEKDAQPQLEEADDDLDSKLNYKPPPQKSLKELQEMDKDDESLTKYK
ncbi:hypothetical protein ACQJ0Y_28930, partial [Peribacillus simplex]|uniref:hypothetical protein n=1 Tax=Peribacillus simplex TaxID=1478 RepID=UPI003CF9566D